MLFTSHGSLAGILSIKVSPLPTVPQLHSYSTKQKGRLILVAFFSCFWDSYAVQDLHKYIRAPYYISTQERERSDWVVLSMRNSSHIQTLVLFWIFLCTWMQKKGKSFGRDHFDGENAMRESTTYLSFFYKLSRSGWLTCTPFTAPIVITLFEQNEQACYSPLSYHRVLILLTSDDKVHWRISRCPGSLIWTW